MTAVAVLAALAGIVAVFAAAYWVRQDPPAEDAPRQWRNAGRRGGPALWVGPGWEPQQSRLEASA